VVTMPNSNGSTPKSPANNTSGILTGTGLHAWIEACRRFEMAQHDAYHMAASILQKGIERYAKGRKGLMGMDVKLAARKITKPIRHVGDLHGEAAKALATAWMMYTKTIGTPDKTPAGSFDPSK
jgi:hypothetical protein